MALTNALRYFPTAVHAELASEFARELTDCGHIYMYRFVPRLQLRAVHIDRMPAKCQQAAAIMVMMLNNLDHKIAQFPHELVR